MSKPVDLPAPPPHPIRWKITEPGKEPFTVGPYRTAFEARRRAAVDLRVDPMVLRVQPADGDR